MGAPGGCSRHGERAAMGYSVGLLKHRGRTCQQTSPVQLPASRNLPPNASGTPQTRCAHTHTHARLRTCTHATPHRPTRQRVPQVHRLRAPRGGQAAGGWLRSAHAREPAEVVEQLPLLDAQRGAQRVAPPAPARAGLAAARRRLRWGALPCRLGSGLRALTRGIPLLCGCPCQLESLQRRIKDAQAARVGEWYKAGWWAGVQRPRRSSWARASRGSALGQGCSETRQCAMLKLLLLLGSSPGSQQGSPAVIACRQQAGAVGRPLGPAQEIGVWGACCASRSCIEGSPAIGVSSATEGTEGRSPLRHALFAGRRACRTRTCILIMHVVEHMRRFVLPKLQLQQPRHRAGQAGAAQPPWRP